MKLARLFAGLAITAAVIMAQHAAHAASTGGYLVGSQFRDVVVTEGTGYDVLANAGAGSSSLDWQLADCAKCTGSSTLAFDGFRLPGQGQLGYSALTQPFELGKLRFHNGTGIGDPGLLSASLALSVSLEGAASPLEFIFGLSLAELGVVDRKNKGADLLKLTSDASSFSFRTDAGDFALTLLGWSADGGNTFSDSFAVGDTAHAKIKLYGAIMPVPVPAAVWLFGSGLAALIGLGRRR